MAQTLKKKREKKKEPGSNPYCKKSPSQAQGAQCSSSVSGQPGLAGSRLSWPTNAYVITPAEHLEGMFAAISD